MCVHLIVTSSNAVGRRTIRLPARCARIVALAQRRQRLRKRAEGFMSVRIDRNRLTKRGGCRVGVPDREP